MWELTQVEYSHTLPLLPIHSHYHPPHSHHSGTSPPGVWPLEGDQAQLPTSVVYDHPEDWVGHGEYRTQAITCTKELNVGVVYCWAACVCVQQLTVWGLLYVARSSVFGGEEHYIFYLMLSVSVICIHSSIIVHACIHACVSVYLSCYTNHYTTQGMTHMHLRTEMQVTQFTVFSQSTTCGTQWHITLCKLASCVVGQERSTQRVHQGA